MKLDLDLLHYCLVAFDEVSFHYHLEIGTFIGIISFGCHISFYFYYKVLEAIHYPLHLIKPWYYSYPSEENWGYSFCFWYCSPDSILEITEIHALYLSLHLHPLLLFIISNLSHSTSTLLPLPFLQNFCSFPLPSQETQILFSSHSPLSCFLLCFLLNVDCCLNSLLPLRYPLWTMSSYPSLFI